MRAERTVPAYRKYLDEGSTPASFSGRPVMTKDSYVRRYPVAELFADNISDTFAVFASSGSSGSAHYWPHLRGHSRFAPWAARRFLERAFSIHRKRTMAIVAAAMGSWIGGDYLSWLLKTVALRARYPFAVFAPGKRHSEIINTVCDNILGVEQFVILLCPSDISHLHHFAESMGKALPLGKLRYVVMGEPIPEPIRISLQRKAGISQDEPFLFSMYGSTETGLLGVESEGTVAVRKLLATNPRLAEHLGLGAPVPHLFHYCAPDAYLEIIDGELCVTRWQGIPIIRYNLQDRATLLKWRSLRRFILQSTLIEKEQEPLREAVRRTSPFYFDLIVVHGRSDRCLILGGSNLTEAILDEALRTAAPDWLTGQYRARVAFRDDQQFLEMDVELRSGISASPEVEQRIYPSLIETIGRLQPEFRVDWENVYRKYDDNPRRRILQLQFHAWPALSNLDGNRAKQVSIGRIKVDP